MAPLDAMFGRSDDFFYVNCLGIYWDDAAAASDWLGEAGGGRRENGGEFP